MGNPQKHNFLPLEQQLKEVSEEFNFIDPVTLLQGLANGVDLRGHSKAYLWVLDHEAQNGDEIPGVWEWEDLAELIKSEFRFLPIDKGTSLQASKVLIEYMHNKKKAVEVTDKTSSGEVTELTRNEIKRVQKIFKNEY